MAIEKLQFKMGVFFEDVCFDLLLLLKTQPTFWTQGAVRFFNRKLKKETSARRQEVINEIRDQAWLRELLGANGR
jgi:hypothetical protein